jgi:hypothetical protein
MKYILKESQLKGTRKLIRKLYNEYGYHKAKQLVGFNVKQFVNLLLVDGEEIDGKLCNDILTDMLAEKSLDVNFKVDDFVCDIGLGYTWTWDVTYYNKERGESLSLYATPFYENINEIPFDTSFYVLERPDILDGDFIVEDDFISETLFRENIPINRKFYSLDDLIDFYNNTYIPTLKEVGMEMIENYRQEFVDMFNKGML